MFTPLYMYIDFSDAQGQVTPSQCRIWLKFELIQVFMHVLVSYKNKEESIKTEGARVFITFSHYKSVEIFPDAQGLLTQKSVIRSGRVLYSFEILRM